MHSNAEQQIWFANGIFDGKTFLLFADDASSIATEIRRLTGEITKARSTNNLKMVKYYEGTQRSLRLAYAKL